MIKPNTKQNLLNPAPKSKDEKIIVIASVLIDEDKAPPIISLWRFRKNSK